MSIPTKAQQLKELERELKMRAQAYPKWVAQGRMTQADMDHRMTCLRLVIRDFIERHNPHGIQQGLGI